MYTCVCIYILYVQHTMILVTTISMLFLSDSVVQLFEYHIDTPEHLSSCYLQFKPTATFLHKKTIGKISYFQGLIVNPKLDHEMRIKNVYLLYLPFHISYHKYTK